MRTRGILVYFIVCMGLQIASAKDQPNVVVLLADDLGYQDIGCYGGPVKTPVLDKLAAEGTRFQQFYSGAAVCSPSRASLLTGRHHIRAGVYSWIFNGRQRSHLLEREVTLAEVLKKQGYATAHVGKWHLGLPTAKFKKLDPSDHGFDYWFATDNNAAPSHRNPNNFIRNGKPAGKLEGYSCQLVVDEAISWLDKRESTEPFFLNVWFHEPHAPIAAPEEIVAEYGTPSNGKKKNKKDLDAVYSATIDNTDRAIGRLIEKLKKLGVLKNTLIIYTSDNGSYLANRTGNLRGIKGSNWEGGIRVPGIFSWPGKIAPERTMESPGGIVDILPTVCGLLGIPAPEGVHLDGIDLSPFLLGKDTTFNRNKPMVWHLQKSRPVIVLRDGDYCLTADPDYALSTSNMFNESWIPSIKQGTYKNYQLFNLKEDPGQKKNIAAKHPEVVKTLKAKMLEINASIMSDGPDWNQTEKE